METKKQILELLGGFPENIDPLDSLVEQARTRIGIIPFVGAGISAQLGFPQWSGFLRLLAERCGKGPRVETRLKASEYEEAAEDLRRALGPRQFDDLLESHFGDARLKKKKLDGAIVRIPELCDRAVVTTNFDGAIEAAFRRAGTPIKAVWGREAGTDGARALQRDEFVLLKLHGDRTAQAGRVLTRAEYGKQYGDADSSNVDLNLPVPSLLFAMLATRALLFLGCSLKQDRTAKVLMQIARKFPRNAHYAVVERPIEASELHARAAGLSRLGIRPIWYANGDHDRIETLLAWLAQQARPAKTKRAGAKSKPSAATSNNIPHVATPLIGRRIEVEQITAMLETSPLVTVSGGPGCGKTRLAIAVASELLPQYPDGVWFVELDSLPEGRLIAQRIANVMGVREQASQPPLDPLSQHLATRKVALVLDNCEHLAEECAHIAEHLIERCPRLRIVATSRTVLKSQSEYVYEVWPLHTPEAEARPDLEKLARNESVELFLDRAKAHVKGFALTAANARSIAELCRALDGIPLALQLAAARLGARSVDDIVRALKEGLDVLRGEAASQRRHWETLTAAIAWSYGLLNADQQAFLRKLSVFHGGWTRDAAVALCGDDHGDAEAVLDLLQELHDHSLVVSREANNVKRYRLLEPVRQFALAELKKAKELAEYQRRHAEWYVAFSERAAPELLGNSQGEWLDALVADADNLRATILWAMTRKDVERALRFMGALWRFFEIRGFLREGRERLEAALAMEGTERFPALRSLALSGAGMLAYRQGDFDGAEPMFTERLALERQLGNQAGIANALNDLGNVAQRKGNLPRARELYDESLAIARELNLDRDIAIGLFSAGSIAYSLDDLREAATLLEESAQRFEAAGNLRDAAFPLNVRARIATQQGQLPAARSLAARSLDIRREVGDKRGVAETLRTLASIEIESRAWGAAREALLESLNLARGVGDQRGLAETICGFALLAGRNGNPEESVVMYGAADALYRQVQLVMTPPEAKVRDAALNAARGGIAEADYQRYWEQGSALNVSQTAERAIDGPGGNQSSAHT